jgi:hypothetical protein
MSERAKSVSIKDRITASFDKGQVPSIVLIDKTHNPWGQKLTDLKGPLQKFVDEHFGPVWGISAKLSVANEFVAGSWAMAFLDTADEPGALGYHDLTPDGLPLAKIFTQTTLRDRQKVSVTACHELAEMLVDPAINLSVQTPDGEFYAYETCDAVEGLEFDIDGIAMSDFVYPAWFEGFRANRSDQFDHLSEVAGPFELLQGGYMPAFVNGKWTQVFGSHKRKMQYLHQDRRGHRSERRGTLLRRSTAP